MEMHGRFIQDAEDRVWTADKSVQDARSTVDEQELRKSSAELLKSRARASSAMHKHKRESIGAQKNWELLAWHALLTRRWPAPGTVVGGAPCWEEAKANAEALMLGADSASAAVLIA
jgi:hypothetical protein